VVLRSGRLGKYGRTLARIEVNRKDVGRTLIEMRLAQPWVGQKANGCG
jgi:endonuclease YncB( thermonuclease family)